ncbi:MAG: hypothetical protein ACOY0T_03855 [Myxococcota bacterium]
MFPRVPAWLLCLALPVLVVRRELGQLADSWGKSWGGIAADLAPKLVSAPARAEDDVALQRSLASFAEAEKSLAASPPRSEPAPKTRRGKATKAKQAHGVFVSASSVLRLANGGAAMPRAVFVPALGERPAGLRLIGVSGLGIGMRDGDVLTRVLGADVSSVPEVVQRVLAARNRRAPQISGEFWRDGARWSLVVEQPYIDDAPAAPSAR